MNELRLVGPLAPLLNAAYAPEEDASAWLEGVRAQMERAFAGYDHLHAFETRIHPTELELVAIAGDERWHPIIAASHRRSDASILEFIKCGVMALRKVPHDHPGRQLSVGHGLADGFAAVGFADSTRASLVTMGFGREGVRISRACRVALSRVSAHLGAALRLRARTSAPNDAVLAPSGELLHAEGSAREASLRERLRDAAIGVMRAKRERDPLAASAFWSAMVDGRWTLVERFDTDGKRLLLAKRNAPDGVAHHALTARERAVVERAGLGGTLRHVAYELGMAESTVSETLSRAMKKLGVRSRAELIEVCATFAENGPGG